MKSEVRSMFYLTTAGEYKLLSKPRACRFVRRMRDINRDDYMLVEIDPPLIDQSFGLGGIDVTTLLLATRHQGWSLFPVKEWPTHVYVARIVDPKLLEATVFTRDQVQLIAWGMVFDDLQEASGYARGLESELV